MSIKNPRRTKQKRRELRRNMTKAEELFWERVRRKQISETRFKRQYGIGPYILDFYVPKYHMAIEIDGGIHEVELVKQKDTNKDTFLEENGIRVVRFRNEEVLSDIEEVVRKLEKLMHKK